jgi:hypothetical protein
LGPLASEGLANVYLPSSEQTIGKTLTRFAADLAWRVGGNMFKDYWPTFFRNMGLNKLRVIPDPAKSSGLEQARPRQFRNRLPVRQSGRVEVRRFMGVINWLVRPRP